MQFWARKSCKLISLNEVGKAYHDTSKELEIIMDDLVAFIQPAETPVFVT